jgi:3'-phosphoadenosine 5'-phosphosulfate (PAPS) 3'-phosphatase
MLFIALRQKNMFFYPYEGLWKWDTCAGDALLLASGAQHVGFDGARYNYSATSDNRNLNGAICAFDEESI